MSIEQYRSTVKRHRRGPTDQAGVDANTAREEMAGYFGIVSWLAALGTLIAVSLVVTCPISQDVMWLFSQVP